MNTIIARHNQTHQRYDNGYCIATYILIDDQGRDVSPATVIGLDLPDDKDLTYELIGTWEEDFQHGQRFKATNCIARGSSDVDGIIDFLKMLPGCGEKTAGRIFNAFGSITFLVLDKTPGRLMEVHGITEDRAQKILQSWDTPIIREVKALYQSLMHYKDFTPSLAAKTYDTYGAFVWQTLNDNPYALTTVKGFSFELADAIAIDRGFQADDFNRIAYASTQVLWDDATEKGNLGMTPEDFLQALKDLLNKSIGESATDNARMIDDIRLAEMVHQVVLNGRFIVLAQGDETQYVYLKNVRDVETEVAHAISLRCCRTDPPNDLREKIIAAFKKCDMEPDEWQIRAVEMVFCYRISIIAGGPGTGKTTLVNVIKEVEISIHKDKRICYLAPTGKAARRLEESVGEKAQTIHRELGMYVDDEGNIDNTTPCGHINAKLVVVDETSMVDIFLAKKLLSALEWDARIVLVGDPAQLQSVGPGAFFRDLIDSGRVPTTKLDHIYRQSTGSLIISNAMKIAHGCTDLVEGPDFIISKVAYGPKMYDAMAKTYVSEVNEYGAGRVACICPTNDEVDDMNIRIQELVNPKADGKNEICFNERVFRVGDRVMEQKNSEDVVNGEIGTITAIDSEEETVGVSYHGGISVTYVREDLSNKEESRLKLAYAMTVHKAQGSEYDSVITCMRPMSSYVKVRSIPYTAITRARMKCQYFGKITTLQDAIKEDDSRRRQTLLANDIKDQFNAIKRGKT